MRRADLKAVGDHLSATLKRGNYPRLVNSCLRGTVASVLQPTAGGAYSITLVRTNELNPDGDIYACTAGWCPVPGMAVEVMWRDAANAWVLCPAIGPAYPHAEVALTGGVQAISNNILNVVAFDAITGGQSLGDPFNLVSGLGTTGFAFTAPAPGRYLVTAEALWSSAFTCTASYITVVKNGGEHRRGMQMAFANTGLNPALVAASVVRCAANDTLAVGIEQNSGGSQNLANNANSLSTGAQFTWIGT